MKTLAIFLFFWVMPVCGIAGTDAGNAQAFFRTKLDAVLETLQDGRLGDSEKQNRVMEIILPAFDLPLMAKLSVGKTHWTGFTGNQKQRFSDAFQKKLQAAYLETILKFTDEKVVYHAPLAKGRKVWLPLDLVSDTGQFKMIYKLYDFGKGWRIYDVEIEGVSILTSFRVQISDILGRESVEDLIDKFMEP